MANRMLENALATSATSEMKTACRACEKRHLCHRIADVISDIGQVEMRVWDLEHQIRFRSLMRELSRLGYEFPEGYSLCDVSRLSRREVTDLLREAQELLIEMKDLRCSEDDLDKKSV